MKVREGNANHTNHVQAFIKVDNILGGMRGLKAMLWDASVLDPLEVRFMHKFRNSIALDNKPISGH